jgi:hypothetical protein
MNSRYIQFYNERGPALGSDSVMYLDGRWSRLTSMDQARSHASKLNRLHNKGYTGFAFEGESTIHGI